MVWFDAWWHKWFTKQWHEVIDFGDQEEVRGQGHTSLKIDLEASLSTPVGRVGFII